MGVFFFKDTATAEIYTLSLHDALPILRRTERGAKAQWRDRGRVAVFPGLIDCHTHLPQYSAVARGQSELLRSEEHTSELQSRPYLVCRLLLEKKNYIFASRIIFHTSHL